MSVMTQNMFSYNLSEDEVSKLPTLHRFVWKGKLHKVLSVLSDSSKKNKVNKKDYFQRTPYHLAASRGDVKMLKFLLSIDTKTIHHRDTDGRTAFYKACQCLSLECMQVLVSYGSRTVCTDFKKCSIMEKLVIEFGDGSLKHLEYLIANQPKDCKLLNEKKVMFTAVKYGRIGVVKLLIQLGFDVDAIEEGTGKTLLMKAIESSYFNITEALLKGDANVHIADAQRKTAIDYSHDKPRIHNLLKEYDNSNDTLDDPSKNKVFVTFHKSTTVESQLTPSPQNERKNDLLMKIKEIENEIESSQVELNKSKRKRDELDERLQSDKHEAMVKKTNDKEKSKASLSSKSIEIHQRPKVMLKKLFKAGYQSKKEWAAEFDSAVEKYDELQRGYEQLLLAESEKELEIEECLDEIENAEIKKAEDEKKLIDLKNELKLIQEDISRMEKEKSELQNQINEKKSAISDEKSRFKHVIERANQFKSQLLNTIDQLKSKKKEKMEELKVFVDEEEKLLAEIKECDDVINDQKRRQHKIVNKIRKLKNVIDVKNVEKNTSE